MLYKQTQFLLNLFKKQEEASLVEQLGLLSFFKPDIIDETFQLTTSIDDTQFDSKLNAVDETRKHLLLAIKYYKDCSKNPIPPCAANFPTS